VRRFDILRARNPRRGGKTAGAPRKSFCASSTPRAQKDLRESVHSTDFFPRFSDIFCGLEERRAAKVSNRRTIHPMCGVCWSALRTERLAVESQARIKMQHGATLEFHFADRSSQDLSST
jgi:hypothetical protein